MAHTNDASRPGEPTYALTYRQPAPRPPAVARRPHFQREFPVGFVIPGRPARLNDGALTKLGVDWCRRREDDAPVATLSTALYCNKLYSAMTFVFKRIRDAYIFFLCAL
jgi:hypothetical protein